MEFGIYYRKVDNFNDNDYEENLLCYGGDNKDLMVGLNLDLNKEEQPINSEQWNLLIKKIEIMGCLLTDIHNSFVYHRLNKYTENDLKTINMCISWYTKHFKAKATYEEYDMSIINMISFWNARLTVSKMLKNPKYEVWAYIKEEE